MDVSADLSTEFFNFAHVKNELTAENLVLSNSSLVLFAGAAFTQLPKVNGALLSTTEGYSVGAISEDESSSGAITTDVFNSTFVTNQSEVFGNSSYLYEAENATILNYTTTEANFDYESNLDYNDERVLMNLFPNDTIQERNATANVVSSTAFSTSSTSFKLEPSTALETTSELFASFETTSEVPNAAATKRPTSQTTENPAYKKRLRSLCWETMFGQELVKLTVMDLILTVLYILVVDFFRAVFVRYMNNCWCWDLEKKFPQYGDFKVAENILHLVNNQGMVWMGMFFSPGLVVLNVVKLFVIMYLRAWAVLTCNVPHEVLFRASRSNNFYYALLLMMLFLCVLPVGYAIVWIKPSEYCGPFSNCDKIYYIFTMTIKRNLPKSFFNTLEYIASPGIVIPLLLLLVLIIYYFVSLTTALREANDDLKAQLFIERTEERRKVFQIAKTKKGDSGEFANTPFAKWRKLLKELPSSRQASKQFSHETDAGSERESKSDHHRRSKC